jgi:hypothetical protein
MWFLIPSLLFVYYLYRFILFVFHDSFWPSRFLLINKTHSCKAYRPKWRRLHCDSRRSLGSSSYEFFLILYLFVFFSRCCDFFNATAFFFFDHILVQYEQKLRRLPNDVGRAHCLRPSAWEGSARVVSAGVLRTRTTDNSWYASWSDLKGWTSSFVHSELFCLCNIFFLFAFLFQCFSR